MFLSKIIFQSILIRFLLADHLNYSSSFDFHDLSAIDCSGNSDESVKVINELNKQIEIHC